MHTKTNRSYTFGAIYVQCKSYFNWEEQNISAKWAVIIPPASIILLPNSSAFTLGGGEAAPCSVGIRTVTPIRSERLKTN